MMNTLLSPFSEFQRVMDLMDRTMSRVWTDGAELPSEKATINMLPIDVWQKGSNLYVRAAVPGIKPEDLEIQFQNGTLTISGETKRIVESEEDAHVWRCEYAQGRFARSIRLPDNVIDEKIEAAFENGFATITIPLMIQERKSLKIPVKPMAITRQPVLEEKATQKTK